MTDIRLHPQLKFQYRLLRSQRRKTVSIEVHRDQSVKVRAPLRVSKKYIDDLIAARWNWILRQQQRQADLPQPKGPQRFIAGSEHYFLGRKLTLTFADCFQDVATDDKHLILPARYAYDKTKDKTKDETKTEQYLNKWYREQAGAYFQSRLDDIFARISHWQAKEPTLKLRRMTRYWGSCSNKGVITLNVHLIKTPAYLIDYVIGHELCHLREMNHSARFYALQEQVTPAWRQCREDIRTWEYLVLP